MPALLGDASTTITLLGLLFLNIQAHGAADGLTVTDWINRALTQRLQLERAKK